jgi:uncharacterized membrane protein
MAAQEGSSRRDIVRLNAFADGVIVVSMTLLILNIEIPDSVRTLDDTALLQTLASQWPHFIGYALSFFVIAMYWLGYSKAFGGMKEADDAFAMLLVVFLFTIGFIPFATGLLGRNGGFIATTLYASTMIATSLALALMWAYATSAGLLKRQFPKADWWREIFPLIQTATIFGASIVIAWFDPDYAKLSWLLLAVPGLEQRVRKLPATSRSRE